MRIALITNTAPPHIGGTVRIVCASQQALQSRGHDVVIIGPDCSKVTESSENSQTIQDQNGTETPSSPISGEQIFEMMKEFQPELIHCHHPFMSGDIALRYALQHHCPLIFTNHAVLEQCSYASLQELDTFSQLTAAYCNLCNHIVAPTCNTELMLRNLGVVTPISVIPTGIDLAFFSTGDGAAYRKELAIERDAIVIGYVGRLADEKNLHFLAHAVGWYLHEHPAALFLVVGAGAETSAMLEILTQHGIRDRVVFAGHLSDDALVNAYAAMDVFAFASQAESEAIVVIEALSSGCPVVALDGPGVRNILDERNGRLLGADASYEEFSAAIAELTEDSNRLWRIGEAARETVHCYGLESCTDKLLSLYETIIANFQGHSALDLSAWSQTHTAFQTEWERTAHEASCSESEQ